MKNLCVQTLASCTLLGLHAISASAQSADPAPEPATPAAPTAAVPEGLLPIPDYTGDIWTRRALLGDLNGGRTSLANKGIQFGIDWNQTLQSVVSGGRDESTAYGGTLDYNLTLDLMRMNVLPGALIKLRGESRYGESANVDVAQILPANTDHFMPLTGELEDELPFALTTLTYFQYLSKSFGIFLGKFDTLDGDPNEFASGRGLTQFQNLNLLFSPALLVTVPYSTLGGGLLWSIVPNITLTSSVFTTADSSTTTGFDKIGDGWTWSSEVQFQYRLGHLPGGVNIGGAYAWAQDFSTIGRRFVFTPGEGISPTPDQSDSWGMYASLWQYLFSDEPAGASDAALNLVDGAPDRKGLGIFARVGFADEDTNPFEYTLSGGLGGRGLLPGRDHDLAGIGVFHNQTRSRRLISALGIDDSTAGFEAFYNIALTPAAGLSFDVQVLEPPNERRDTAVLVGARLLLRF
jgi:porin